MPELRIVISLRDSASFNRLTIDLHFVLNIPTLTSNVFKSVKVNLKCTFINHGAIAEYPGQPFTCVGVL